MSLVVTLVGRPNVGKSSLFNALLGFRRTIVLDLPGTTVDAVKEKAKWGDITLVDSQGFLDEGDEKTLDSLIDKSDVCLFVVDAESGPTPFDKWVATRLQFYKKPAALVVNKSDSRDAHHALEFSTLGIDDIIEISAAHRRNIDEVKDWCLARADAPPEEIVEVTEGEESVEKAKPQGPLKLALVGRPNTGKSTLMNRLCREAVSKVSPIAGTTRDPVTHEIQMPQGIIRLIDTAGMRRPRSKKEQVEVFSVQASARAIRDADVVFLCIASHEPLTDQDMRLLNLIVREGKPAALLLNFWDMLDKKQRKDFLDDSEFSQYVNQFKTIPLSGLTGFNVNECISLAFRMQQQSKKRVKTSRLNEVVERIITRNPPPSLGKRNFNILYASQVKTEPPTFVFFMNRKGALPPSYQKYLENALKKNLGFKSQPIRLYFRGDKESITS